MICLFKPAPEGKGNEAWSALGKFACVHSRNTRESFYFSTIKSKHGARQTLLLLGYTSARMVAMRPGSSHGVRAARAFLDKIQFESIVGERPALEGVNEAKSIMPAIKVNYVDGDAPPFRGDDIHTIVVARGFKCDPKVFGQYLVFLVGYWGWVNEGVAR